MFHVFKSMAVEGVFIHFSRDVTNGNYARGARFLRVFFTVSLLLENVTHIIYIERHSPDDDRTRQRSISGNLVVVQLRNNVVLSWLSLLSGRFDDLIHGIAWGMPSSSSCHDWK